MLPTVAGTMPLNQQNFEFSCTTFESSVSPDSVLFHEVKIMVPQENSIPIHNNNNNKLSFLQQHSKYSQHMLYSSLLVVMELHVTFYGYCFIYVYEIKFLLLNTCNSTL
jgi:hypothetical protein